jgi:hypothetical protein
MKNNVGTRFCNMLKLTETVNYETDPVETIISNFNPFERR